MIELPRVDAPSRSAPPPRSGSEWIPDWRPDRSRELLRGTTRLFFSALGRRTVSGLDNVPGNGPVLLVFNHLSNFDPHLVFASLPRRDAVGLVAARYRANPFTRVLVEGAGGIWLQRDAFHPSAIKHAVRLLSVGWLVGISPEGRRSPHSRLVEGKPGPAFLALRTGAPVLPVAVTGTERLLHGLPGLARTRLTLRFGQPFTLSWVGNSDPRERARRVQYRRATTEIMCRIAALLPEEYRGVYQRHPRVAELRDLASARQGNRVGSRPPPNPVPLP